MNRPVPWQVVGRAMRRTLWMLALLVVWRSTVVSSVGQVGYLWTPEELRAKSDVVVVAAAMETRETGVRSELLDLRPPFPVVELVTEFTVLSVLKGEIASRTFLLRHVTPDRTRLPNGIVNGARPLPLTAREHYLLFLRREAAPTFIPVSGHVSPSDSVFNLRKAK